MAINFFKIEIAPWGKEDKVYPSIDGTLIEEGREFFDNDLFENFKYVDNAPVFDYFRMISISEKGAYDWILLDTYGFALHNLCKTLHNSWNISIRNAKKTFFYELYGYPIFKTSPQPNNKSVQSA